MKVVLVVFCLTSLLPLSLALVGCPQDVCLNTYCPTLLAEDCPSGSSYQEHIGPCDCCSACVKYIQEGSACDPTQSLRWQLKLLSKVDLPVVDVPECAPGFSCNGTNGNFTCQSVLGNFPCLETQHAYDEANSQGALQMEMYRPECLPDGSFGPKQCKSNQGSPRRCFCTDSNGNRIFGDAFLSEDEDDEMNCACSRHYWELQQTDRTDVTFHCKPNGNYEELQCDEGLCYCVNDTSLVVVGSMVPETSITQLPCYDAASVGSQYLRRCESMVYHQAQIIQLSLEHGTALFGLPQNNCDMDGSFAPVQSLDDGRSICADSSKDPIGAYAVDELNTELLESMNCYCARDEVDPNFMGPVGMQCEGNGNYVPQQKIDQSIIYCVDTDGYMTSQYIDSNEPQSCCLTCTDPCAAGVNCDGIDG